MRKLKITKFNCFQKSKILDPPIDTKILPSTKGEQFCRLFFVPTSDIEHAMYICGRSGELITLNLEIEDENGNTNTYSGVITNVQRLDNEELEVTILKHQKFS